MHGQQNIKYNVSLPLCQNRESGKFAIFHCHFMNNVDDDSILFSKNTQKSNLMKIRPVGAEVAPHYGQTDRQDNVNSRFSHFCENA
jgi:hypothetical protein